MTCNTAPYVVKHAIGHIEKKLGLTLFNVGSMANTGFNIGYQGAAIAATGTITAAMPVVGVGAFIVRQTYLHTEFVNSAERFLDAMDSRFEHLKMKVKGSEVYYQRGSVYNWCKSNTNKYTFEYAGVTDNIIAAAGSLWNAIVS